MARISTCKQDYSTIPDVADLELQALSFLYDQVAIDDHVAIVDEKKKLSSDSTGTDSFHWGNIGIPMCYLTIGVCSGKDKKAGKSVLSTYQRK